MSKQELKDWRAEEIAKILLRKSSFNLRIENFPTPIFDLFITESNNPKLRFAAEVKTKANFDRNIDKHLTQLVIYRNNGMINIPAIILKVDEPNETAEIDFLVVPSKSGKLLIRKNYDFKKVTSTTLDAYIEKISKWWSNSL